LEIFGGQGRCHAGEVAGVVWADGEGNLRSRVRVERRSHAGGELVAELVG
jgi:hypothetical protein